MELWRPIDNKQSKSNACQLNHCTIWGKFRLLVELAFRYIYNSKIQWTITDSTLACLHELWACHRSPRITENTGNIEDRRMVEDGTVVCVIVMLGTQTTYRSQYGITLSTMSKLLQDFKRKEITAHL